MFKEYLSIFITMLVIMDPLGNVPVILALTGEIDPARTRRIILRESFFAALIMIGFGVFGEWLMRMLSIHIETLKVSGGIILFLVALKMVREDIPHVSVENRPHEPFVTPIATPLLAGPAALVAEIFAIHQTGTSDEMLIVCAMITAALTVTTVILLFSTELKKVLSYRGLEALSKLMGLLLLTLAVEMVLNGVSLYFNPAN